MPDTSIRYLQMLGLIPHRPGKKTPGQINEELRELGFDIDKRSTERDLQKLSRAFPLLGHDDGRPTGWYWERRDTALVFPLMNAHAALTYELLGRYLKPVLPREMLLQMEPEFAQARRVLGQLGASALGKWSNRIAVLSSGQPLLPPEIPAGVSETVYDALLEGKRFHADYRSATSDKVKSYDFNPQALVYRQNVRYLVASVFNYDDALQFALHRMSNAKPLDEPASPLPGFDLQRYIHQEKEFDMPSGDTLRLELSASAWLARILEETRLSVDQTINASGDGESFRIKATVADTEQLVWWLRSFGDEVEVVKPVALRRRMAKEAAAVATMYR